MKVELKVIQDTISPDSNLHGLDAINATPLFVKEAHYVGNRFERPSVYGAYLITIPQPQCVVYAPWDNVIDAKYTAGIRRYPRISEKIARPQLIVGKAAVDAESAVSQVLNGSGRNESHHSA